MIRSSSATSSVTTSFLSRLSYPSGTIPPTHSPRRLCHGNLKQAGEGDGASSVSSSRGRVLPLLHGFDPEETQRAAGDEMALEVEGVVDGGMNGQEALR